MNRDGYYEIRNDFSMNSSLKAYVLAGNVIHNWMHWHEHLELLCCLSGSFLVRAEGIEYKLEEGDLITINSGVSHEIYEGKKDSLQLIVSVDASLLKNGSKERYEMNTVGADAQNTNSPEVRQVIKSLGRMAYLLNDKEGVQGGGRGGCEVLTERDFYEFHQELYQVLFLLSGYKQIRPETITQEKQNEQFVSCLKLLHQEYPNQISVPQLAERIGVSEASFYRMFQKQLGIPFTGYLNSIRLQAACEKLRGSEDSVTEIAAACGFQSLSNFYRAFKEQVGKQPLCYRREQSRRGGRGGNQDDLMSLNEFQPFGELPFEREDLLKLTCK